MNRYHGVAYMIAISFIVATIILMVTDNQIEAFEALGICLLAIPVALIAYIGVKKLLDTN